MTFETVTNGNGGRTYEQYKWVQAAAGNKVFRYWCIASYANMGVAVAANDVGAEHAPKNWFMI
jgi:hypothetical protein